MSAGLQGRPARGVVCWLAAVVRWVLACGGVPRCPGGSTSPACTWGWGLWRWCQAG
jgi:hypothetical protein